ncbi:pitrilysin family protein [Mangrovibacterium marinum]|uniref:Zinc protease n=1 Tax=Mangrovibacterium marinum TaxID=1639118 RepID=A0A2T5C1U2_9BACT|nr:insulinase family protein [Mangrovibacterium marinum]PTN08574.1 zinc protease [Mangrovibacterium marinum]
MKLKLVNLIALFVALSGVAQAQMSTTIPLDDRVVSGVLPNKMHYYIMHNEFPKERVSFYFPQNVGSILENDDQKGLAHFLEHMAFNGTEHFAGKGFLKMLEKQGVRFGADINAYTGYDETVYNISNVPVGEDWLIDSCLYVLHDWSGSLLLQDDEIDAERGVIREEWRTRRNASLRIYEQTSQWQFKGSKYADRMPIGDINIVNNFEYQVLRDYYHKWYRPDLQAVIVVGDINPQEIESKIKAIFSEIPLAAQRAERGFERIPDHDETYFCLATDKEEKYTRIFYKEMSDKPLVKDENYMREDAMSSLVFTMQNKRFEEFIQNNETALLAAQAGMYSASRLQQNFTLFAVPKPGQSLEAYREAYTEWVRARKFGFTQAELDRAKQNIISQYENMVANQDKIQNDAWAQQLYNYFLEADPFLTPKGGLEMQKSVLAGISLQDVNKAVAQFQNNKNVNITVTGPETEGVEYPELADIESVMADVEAADLEAYQEETNDTPLVPDQLTPADVKETFAIPGVDEAKGYVLANGARVIIYPTDLAKDEILFSAYSFGGTSLLPEDELASADFSVSVVENSGLGAFKATDLAKKLTGQIVSITPFIGENTEGFSGSSNIRDFGTLLQLTYLYFTAPRFDENSYKKIVDQYSAYLANASADNKKAMRDTITRVVNNYSPRAQVLNQQFLDAVSLDKAKQVYQERISNASDFCFVFVGNVSEEMLSQIQTYIGNIPGTGKTEQFVDHRMVPAKGKTERTVVRAMDTPKTSVYLNLSGDMKNQETSKLSMYFLGQLLSKKYLDTIREQEGGSYGVGVGASFSTIPDDRYRVVISFDTDPEKLNRLLEVVYEQIDLLKNGTIDMEDFNEVKASVLNRREESVKTNKHWLTDLVDYLQTDDPIYNDEQYKALVEKITPELLVKTAKKVFDKADTVQVVMSPEVVAAN